MECEIISEYQFKDMIVRYIKDEKNIVSLQMFPTELYLKKDEAVGKGAIKKNVQNENLVQLHLSGDTYNEAYASGLSMRNGE